MISIDDEDESIEDVQSNGECIFITGKKIDTKSTKTKGQKIKQQMPWIEKYRPRYIEDVYLDEYTKIKMEKIIKDKMIQNIILTGMPGTGKTTTIKCLANSLYGKNISDAVLELNASDDRGTKSADEIIGNFCKKTYGGNAKDNKNSKHKLIILDEADNLTDKAQHSINKKMDEYNATTRFAFTCNNSADIIEAIQSKCIILRYSGLTVENMIDKLESICEKEKVEYEIDALKEIAILSQGDMRNAINNLQTTWNGFKIITIDNVYAVCDRPQPILLENILINCNNNNAAEAFRIINDIIKAGYSDSDITLGLIAILKYKDTFVEDTKIKMMTTISKYAYNISKGINTKLQMYGMISELILYNIT